jgi:hypothetical protein
MTGVTSGAETDYPSGAPEFPPVFSGVRVTRSLVLCVLFVRNTMNKYSMLHGEVCVRSSSIENNTSINIG